MEIEGKQIYLHGGEMKNSTLLCVGSVCGGTVLQSVHGGEEI